MVAMYIIIVGCGKIGSTILADLVKEGHNVIAIDNDPEVTQEITNIYDVMTVQGNGTDCNTLNEAEVHRAEMFIAATPSDELNMLSCFLAKKMANRNYFTTFASRMKHQRILKNELNYGTLR